MATQVSHAARNDFPYRRLETSTTIRVVNLLPGGDEIKISLSHHDFLTNSTAYEALSYVWGDPLETRPIICEGGRFNVTTNLFLALHRLRDENKPRRIWIDAICINQMDVLERNHQVALMNQIYPRASTVIIWMGEDNDLTEWTYLFIEQATYFYKNHPNPFSEDNAIRKSIRDMLPEQDKFEECANATLEFLENPWFHRAWTFQEAHLSKEATIVCGKFEFSFYSLVMVMMFMFHLGLRAFEPVRGGAANFLFSTYLESRFGGSEDEGKGRWRLRFSNIFRKSHAKGDHGQDKRRLRLSNILRRSHNHLATDPRDQIFAFLAMADGWRVDERHEPDYTLSTEEVYTRFARLIILDDGHLQILSDAQFKDAHKSIPSWVPDWRIPTGTKPFSERRHNFPLEYRVNKGFMPQQVIFDGLDPRKLHLRGAEIDVVESVKDLSPLQPAIDFYHSPGLVGQWRIVLSSFREFFLREFPSFGSYSYTSEDGTTAFIRTITADHLPFYERDNSQVKEWYPVLYDLMDMGWREALSSSAVEAEELHLPPDILSESSPTEEIYHALFVSRYPKQWVPLVINKPEIYEAVTEVLRWIDMVTGGRTFFLTKKGYMGMGPSSMAPGDRIFTLLGGDVPFMLRATAAPEYNLVGEVYVHGIMDGELWNVTNGGKRLKPVGGDLVIQEVILV
jgi:Heterokaryon incompatibility protein (HET)